MGGRRRWLDYEGCSNFRDVGGYASSTGGRVRWGRLYRSDSMSRMAPSIAERACADLRLRTVVDLRTGGEIAALGAARLDAHGVAVVHLPTENPDVATLQGADPEAMGDLYLWNLEQKAPGFATLLELLADRSSLPLVVQCRSGKDRTGIVVAMLLDLLGVSDDDIVADYVRTERVLRRTPREEFAAMVERLRVAGMNPEILHTRAGTMARFLAGVRGRWGSCEGYATAVAGVPSKLLDVVRANLLTSTRTAAS